jgi:hypothetical protein
MTRATIAHNASRLEASFACYRANAETDKGSIELFAAPPQTLIRFLRSFAQALESTRPIDGRSALSYDRKRAAEMVLALMYLDLHEDARAWKGYPWDVLDFLFEGGLITDPARKARSVALTESGLAEATRCFDELLASEPAVVDRPTRTSKAAALPDIQRARVDALLEPMCQPHPDPQVAAQVQRGYHVERAAVVLYERRPSFLKPEVWHEHPVAKFQFNKSRGTWQLHCMFRDRKWRLYEPLPESVDLGDLVHEVETDPTGIFWG